MAIQMMKGYGFPSARTVDFSGTNVGSFGDFAMGEFLGGHDPSQFRKIPALDGYGYESYNAAGEDEATMALACRSAGGIWDGVNGVCQTRAGHNADPRLDPTSPQFVPCVAGHNADGSALLIGQCDQPGPQQQQSQPSAPPPSNTLGKVLGWGAAIYFAARMLK